MNNRSQGSWSQGGPGGDDAGAAASADIERATRRLVAALDALASAVERQRDADLDDAELASRIQALGADRSRLADELDATLVRSRKLERANRDIATRLDAAIATIEEVVGEPAVAVGDTGAEEQP